MITLTLRVNGERANVDLPTSVAEVHTIASALMPEWPIEIENVSGPIRNLVKYIRHANLESESDIQSLNRLAEKINRMTLPYSGCWEFLIAALII